MTIKERNEIVNKNLGLIKPIIRKVLSRKSIGNSLNEDDLFQEGVIALMKAATLYDKTKGFKFSTYACNYIFLRLLDYINDNYFIRIPSNTNNKSNKIDSEAIGLPEHIQAAINVKKKKFFSLKWTIGLALNNQCPHDDEDHVNNLMSKLNNIDKDIVRKHFYEEATLRDIGKDMGLTRQAISYRMKNIMEKLKNASKHDVT